MLLFLPSIIQMVGDKVSALVTHLLSSRLYCPLERFKRGRKRCEFPTLFFQRVASITIFERKMVVVSSQLYCRSTMM